MILPAAPPPELDAAIEAAWQRASALAANGRELHFTVDAAGELVIEVRDTAGRTVKTISPSQAVNVMGGLHQV
jgi:hypothetical protein